MTAPPANQPERDRWNDPAWLHRWTRTEPLLRGVTPVLIRTARLSPGEAVLDIGCGGGGTTIAATRAVGHWGRVVGVDLSSALLGRARTRASAFEEGIRARFVQADVQTDALPGGPFDAAISQFGTMFFDDPTAAFDNVGRALGPGGRLALAVWRDPDRNPWHLGAALIRAGVVTPRQPGTGRVVTGPFSWADPDHAVELLGRCGFCEVTVTPQDHVLEAPVSALVTDNADLTVLGVPPEALDRARAAIGDHLQPYLDDAGGLRLPMAFQIVTARLNAPRGAA